MAFKEVNDLSTDTTISLGGTNRKTGKTNPKSIEGYYLGKREVQDNKKKSGISYIYIFQTPKGNVGVWGKTDLDRKMSGVTPGTMVRASHVGMTQTPNGEMYKYRVEFDEENTIEVSAENSSGNLEGGNTGDGFSQGSAEGFDEGVEQEYTAVQETGALAAAAERKAKVEALLRGGSKGKSAKN